MIVSIINTTAEGIPITTGDMFPTKDRRMITYVEPDMAAVTPVTADTPVTVGTTVTAGTPVTIEDMKEETSEESDTTTDGSNSWNAKSGDLESIFVTADPVIIDISK
jgi:hypothetical protein